MSEISKDNDPESHQHEKGGALKTVIIRKKTTADVSQILAIEERCYEEPWTQYDFKAIEIRTGSKFFVADNAVSVCGYMLAQRMETCFSISNMAVASWCRRSGVGGKLIDELKIETMYIGLPFIEYVIPDDRTEGHLFLKSQGFRAIRVQRNFFDGKDGYMFRWFNIEG